MLCAPLSKWTHQRRSCRHSTRSCGFFSRHSAGPPTRRGTERTAGPAAQPHAGVALRGEPPSADLRRLLERRGAGSAGGALPPARVAAPRTAGPRRGRRGVGEWGRARPRWGAGRGLRRRGLPRARQTGRALGRPAESRAVPGAEDPSRGSRTRLVHPPPLIALAYPYPTGRGPPTPRFCRLPPSFCSTGVKERLGRPAVGDPASGHGGLGLGLAKTTVCAAGLGPRMAGPALPAPLAWIAGLAPPLHENSFRARPPLESSGELSQY
uniref:Uncharacterized protein n=1 Tax=Rangifer tarandus platyrhynchus TaxID=3082113 RepID=A0ACB0ENT2_RANTA|nr:unnamed protein product [Rangifer tarandus platyrhynchus]